MGQRIIRDISNPIKNYLTKNIIKVDNYIKIIQS